MEAGKRDRTVFGWAAVLLVFIFIGHLMPADEVPSPTLKTLSIVIELCLVVGLIGMAPRVLRSVPEGPERRIWIVLLVVGLISGIGILGIRISGGPRVELSSRTSKSSTPAKGLPKQLHELLQSTGRRTERFNSSHWAQVLLTKDPAKIKTLTRRDFQEAQQACRELRENIDEIVKIFAEAASKKIDLSTASTEPGATRAETWRVVQEGVSASCEYLGLIDQHWDEWIADPLGTGRDVKPWQLEVARLGGVAADASTRFQALLEPGTAPTPVSSESAAVRKQLHDLAYSWLELVLKLQDTNWMKTDVVKRRMLPRRDLQEAREIFRKAREQNEKILKVFAEAESKRIDLSGVLETPALARPEYWRAVQRGYGAADEKFGLIDQNWDEYIAHPFPGSESDLKPWQREVNRLDEVRVAASKEMNALLNPEAARLIQQMHELLDKWEVAFDKLRGSRWMKAERRQDVTRRDLEDARGYCREEGQLTEQILKELAEAEPKRIDLSGASDDAMLTRPEYWRLFQSMMKARCERLDVLEQHWDEWKAEGDGEKTAEKKLKAWQREAKRLREAGEASGKQLEALVASASATPAPTPPPVPPSSAVTPSLSQNSTAPPIPPNRSVGPFLPRQPTAPAVPQNSAAPPSAPGNSMDELVLKTHLLPAVGDYVQALSRLQQTRWVKSPNANAYHPQKITRADLHDANEKLREFIASVDKVIADLNAVTGPVPANEKEYWRVKREVSLLFQQLTTLLEENWNEWHVTGIQPRTGEPKPWQKDALRLQNEIDKLKEMKLSSVLL